MSYLNIFIIDDHKIIRDGIKLMLAKEEEINIIGEAGSANEALDFLSKHHKTIGVILMDISMPKMNGIELTKEILSKYPDLKILAITMHAEDNYIINMIEAGALGYILKESGTEEIIKAIKTVASGKKYYSNDVSVTMINYMMNGNKKDEKLSEREEEVLKLIAMGKTNKEAAEELFLSDRTIETHRRNILAKLDCKNSAELIHYALKNNLISL